MEARMTKPALRAQDAVHTTSFFQELVFESSTRNPSDVDSIIPPSAFPKKGVVVSDTVKRWVQVNKIDASIPYVFTQDNQIVTKEKFVFPLA